MGRYVIALFLLLVAPVFGIEDYRGYKQMVIDDGATCYFRLGDASGTTAASAYTGGSCGSNTMTYTNSPTLGVNPGNIKGDPSTAVKLTAASSNYVSISMGSGIPDVKSGSSKYCNIAYEAWIVPTASHGFGQLFPNIGDASNFMVYTAVRTDESVTTALSNQAGGQCALADEGVGNGHLSESVPNHYVFRLDNSGASCSSGSPTLARMSVYVNGVQTATTTTFNTPNTCDAIHNTSHTFWIGRRNDGLNYLGLDRISDFAVYAGGASIALSDALIAKHYYYGKATSYHRPAPLNVRLEPQPSSWFLLAGAGRDIRRMKDLLTSGID